MTLKKIQKLQLVWVVLGLGYNGVSLWRLSRGDLGLAPTDAVVGAIFVALCGIVIWAGLSGAKSFYKYAVPCLTIFLAYTGVVLHVNAYLANADLPGYASVLSWLAAIVINIYGVATLAVGSWLSLRR